MTDIADRLIHHAQLDCVSDIGTVRLLKEAAAEIERLRKASAPPQVSPWQPIETARKDDEECIELFKPDERRSGWSQFLGYWDNDGNGWRPVSGAYIVDGVTHWKPKSAPPSVEAIPHEGTK